MPNISWDVAADARPIMPRQDTPDIGNAFLSAYQAADQRNYERERQAKADAIAADDRQYNRARQAKADAWTDREHARTEKSWASTDQAGEMLAQGDNKGAANELYKSGNIDGGMALEEKHQAHLTKALAMAEAVTPIAAAAQTPEEFNHFLDVAQSRGVDVSKYRFQDPAQWQRSQKQFLLEHNYEAAMIKKQMTQMEFRKAAADAASAEKKATSGDYAVNSKTGQLYSQVTGQPPAGSLPVDAAGGGANTPAAQAFSMNYAEKEAPKNFTESAKSFNDAREASGALNDMAALVPKIKTGFGAEERLMVQKLGNWLGVQVDPSVANTETFQALSQKAVITLAGKLKPLSNSDIVFVQKAVASINSDPSTLMTLLPQLQAVAARSQLAAQMEMQYLRQGMPPDVVAIAQEVEARIPSPIQQAASGPQSAPGGQMPQPGTQPPPGQQPGAGGGQGGEIHPEDAQTLVGAFLQVDDARRPALIASFNKNYGPGAAERILGLTPRQSQQPAAQPQPYSVPGAPVGGFQ